MYRSGICNAIGETDLGAALRPCCEGDAEAT